MTRRLLVPALSLLLVACAVFAQPVPPATATAPALSPPTGATRMNLWQNTPNVVPGQDKDVDPTIPTLDAYVPAANVTKCAIIVLPGGGYTNLSTIKEGKDVAEMFASHGITAFVLRYRHAPRYKYPVPQEDVARAIRLVRSKAADYHIDPARIGIMGFSAGGHLASSISTHFDLGKPDAADPIDKLSCRPDFAILCYPVITFTDDAATHKGSRTALVGNDETLWKEMSSELHVTKDTPPTFLYHTDADKTVPSENSVLYYLALRKAKVDAELHIFQPGGHGSGLGLGDGELKAWPALALSWIDHHGWTK